jgi:predicted transcriptional regulator
MPTRPFSELQKKMSPERRARNEAYAKHILELMALHELRKARRMSQAALAEGAQMTQSEISKIEKRSDMKISTLSDYIEGLGGSPEKTVKIQLVP